MDDFVTRTDASLYDMDFYAWTRQQAALIRQGRLASADLPNIVEEIETLGRKEVAELRSRLTVLLQHLLKVMHQPERAGRSWRTTILVQRLELARHIDENPSLKSRLADAFGAAYADARELAASETGLTLDTFPMAAPFTREQALSKDWQP